MENKDTSDIKMIHELSLEEVSIKMQVQACCEELGQWLGAVVLEKSDRSLNLVKLHWNGFPRNDDDWTSVRLIRKPLTERLVQRKAVQKCDFPRRNHPAFLRAGDIIVEKLSGIEHVVEINDPFLALVSTENTKKLQYEEIKELPQKDVDTDFVLYEDIEESPTVEKVFDLDDIIAPLCRVNALELDYSHMKTPSKIENNQINYLITPTIPHEIPQPSEKLIKILVKEVKELRKDNQDLKNQVNGMEEKLDCLINLIVGKKNKLKSSNNTTHACEVQTHAEQVLTQVQQVNNTLPPLVMPLSPVIQSQPHDGLFEPGVLLEQHGEEAMGFVHLLNHLGPPTQIETTPKKNKKPRIKNPCVTFIKDELSRIFTEEKLATQRFQTTKRKQLDSGALSPKRLKTITDKARKKFSEEYKNIKSINEVVNSKCKKG